MQFAYGLPAALIGAATIAIIQPAPARTALGADQVATIAEQIMVRIDGQAPGSGVLFAQQGQTYFVLTAAHVVATPDEYEVVAPDGQRHKLNYQLVKKLPSVDLAVVQFNSPKKYQIAKLGDSGNVKRGLPIFVAGWPGGGTAINNPTLLFVQGMVAASSQVQQADGYGLVYNNPTLPGMSGGAVLNNQGELVGIHGRGETDRQQKTSDPGVVVKIGLNLGVPINVFRGLAPKAGIALAPLPGAKTTPVATSGKRTVDDFLVQATQLLQTRDFKGALAAANRVIELDPNTAEAFSIRAEARLNSLGRNAMELRAERNRPVILEVEKDINEAIRLNPNDPRTHVGRATIRRLLGDIQGVIANINQALKLDPKSADAYGARASLKLSTQDWRGALEDYNLALKLSPQSRDSPVWLNNRGNARAALRDYSGALQDYTEAIRLEPTNATYYANRGVERIAMGDKEGGMGDLQKAADLALAQGQQETYETIVKLMKQIR
jgi:tetratricopeptide (TPR) repeat protein